MLDNGWRRVLKPGKGRSRPATVKTKVTFLVVCGILITTTLHFLFPLLISETRSAQEGVAIIAACRDWDRSLQVALETWLGADLVSRVIVVDWSSPRPLASQIGPQILRDKRLLVVRVDGTPRWVATWAFNTAMQVAVDLEARKLLKVGCNTVLSPDFVQAHPLEGETFYATDWEAAAAGSIDSLNGIVFAHASTFLAANGYDERLQTPGWVNSDLSKRMERLGLKRRTIEHDYVYHLDRQTSRSKVTWGRSNPVYVQVETQKNRILAKQMPPWDRQFERAKMRVQNQYSMVRAPEWHVTLKDFSPPQESYVNESAISWAYLDAVSMVLLKARVPIVVIEQLSLPYMLKMVPGYYVGMPLLIVHVQHGLANRLRALASAMVVADKTRRHLRVVWEKDQHCNTDFTDLFKGEGVDVWTMFDEQEIDGPHFDVYNYMEKEGGMKGQGIVETANHIYCKSAYRLEHWSVTNESLHQKLLLLVPVQTVKDLVDSVELDDGFVGVHIRAADPAEEISSDIVSASYTPHDLELIKNYRQQTRNISMFEEQMKDVLNKAPDIRFFLASDDKEAISKITREWGPRVVYVLKEEDTICWKDTSRDVECQRYALANMLLLAKTRFILGSFWSSYSEVAGLLGNVDVKYGHVVQQ